MDRQPLYACHGCREDRTFEKEMLRVFGDELWCEDCYVYEFNKDDWSELQAFVPAHEARITELEAQIESMKCYPTCGNSSQCEKALPYKAGYDICKGCPDYTYRGNHKPKGGRIDERE